MYPNEFTLLERKNCQERQRMFLKMINRNICGHFNNLP